MKNVSIYKKLCVILLKRLIMIEREISELQDHIPNDDKKIIRVYIEKNEIIPILEMDDILGITNDNLGDLFFEDLCKIIEDCPEETLKIDTEKLLKKYVIK